MGALVVLLIIIGVIVLAFVIAYNGLVRSRNQAENAWAQISVQLKRRHDLIPNLVEAVKDYMSYEKEVLENVTKARAQAMSAKSVAEAGKAEGLLSAALGRLFAVVENYPELRANQNVLNLQEELTSTENKISFARQFYNDCVMRYNIKCEKIPTNIVASICGFEKKELFEIPEAETEVPKVDLR